MDAVRPEVLLVRVNEQRKRYPGTEFRMFTKVTPDELGVGKDSVPDHWLNRDGTLNVNLLIDKEGGISRAEIIPGPYAWMAQRYLENIGVSLEFV